jgi:ubiquinone/menaquinone biosynthesis C-methylase UbiE
MVAEAAQRDSESAGDGPMPLAQAGAAAIPFADGSFDAALACLVFEHIDDVDGAIADVARVLRTGGTFLFLLNHPLLQTPDSGWIDDQIVEPPEQYWRIGPYLVEQATVEEVQKDVFIRFIHRPLSRYLNALARNGLLLAEMIEPAPPEGFLAQAPQFRDAATVPRLLVLRLVKGAPVDQRL